MLIDAPEVEVVDPILAMVAAVNGRSPKTKRLQQGVYEVGHFGSSGFLREFEHYPDLGELHCYGVCDDAANLLEAAPILQDPKRQFVVTLTEVRRDSDNKGNGGGWRWHKWGPYIGKQEPTTEYLDDEPHIERVYTYHIYERA